MLELMERKLKGVFNVYDFIVEIDPGNIVNWPAVMVSTDELRFVQNTMRTSRVRPVTHVYTLFKNVKAVNREKFKRHGVYPLVLGIARLFDGAVIEKEGAYIDMDPIEPSSAVEIVHAALAEAGIIMFDIRLLWGFEIEQTDSEEAEASALVTIANKWLLDGEAENELVTDIVEPNEKA